MRDSQRQKVYDAEKIAFGYVAGGEPDARYDVGGIDGAQALIDAVFASEFLREKYDCRRAAPRVVQGHGNRDRGCFKRKKNEIHLPRWTQQKWYVLHEAAHALTQEIPRDVEPAHGVTFAKCYVDLVRVYMSRFHALSLEAAYMEKRVKFKPKRAYRISDAERARRAERARGLAAAKR